MVSNKEVRPCGLRALEKETVEIKSSSTLMCGGRGMV